MKRLVTLLLLLSTPASAAPMTYARAHQANSYSKEYEAFNQMVVDVEAQVVDFQQAGTAKHKEFAAGKLDTVADGFSNDKEADLHLTRIGLGYIAAVSIRLDLAAGSATASLTNLDSTKSQTHYWLCKL